MVLFIAPGIIRPENTFSVLIRNSVAVLPHLIEFQFACVARRRPDLPCRPVLAANVLRDIALRDVWIRLPRCTLGVGLNNSDTFLRGQQNREDDA